MYCPDIDETIDEEVCYECNKTECKHHPEHKTDANKERLDKFKSSEFAQDVLTRSAALFGITEELASKRLDAAFVNMQSDTDFVLKELIRDALRSHVAREFDSRAKVLYDEIFNKAIEDKFMAFGKDDQPIVTTVRVKAMEKIKHYVSGLGKQTNRGYNDDKTLDAAISRIVDGKVDEAIGEIKEEAINKFNKEAMKRMMLGMVKTIQDDKRLLAVIAD